MKKLLLGFMALACSALVATSCQTDPPVVPTGVSLNHTAKALTLGETLQLEATVQPANAENKSVTWSSDTPAIATVSEKGLVTAAAEGDAVITATTFNGLTATCSVTVAKNIVHVTKVTVAQHNPTDELTLLEGGTLQLKATVEPATATDKTVIWKSSDETIAKVDENGLVTAAAAVAKETRFTITATSNDTETVKGTLDLSVKHTQLWPEEIHVVDSAPIEFVLDNAAVDAKQLPAVRFVPENPDDKKANWLVRGQADNAALNTTARPGYFYPVAPGTHQLYARANSPKNSGSKEFAESPAEENVAVNVSVTGVTGVSLYENAEKTGDAYTAGSVIAGQSKTLYARSFFTNTVKIPDSSGALADHKYDIDSNPEIQEATAWAVLDAAPAGLQNAPDPTAYNKQGVAIVASKDKATVVGAISGTWAVVQATSKGKTVQGIVQVAANITEIHLFDGMTEIDKDGTIILDVSERTSIDLVADVLPLGAAPRLTWTANQENVLASTTVPDEDSTTPDRYMGTTNDGKITFTALKNQDGNYVAGLNSMSVRTPDPTNGGQAVEVRHDFKITIQVPPTTLEVSTSGLTDGKLGVGKTFTPGTRTTPETATRTVTWKSSNPSVATVNETTGLVTAVEVGTTTITATSVANPSLTDSFELTVNDDVILVTELKRTPGAFSDLKKDGFDAIFVKPGQTRTYNLNDPRVTDTPISRAPSSPATLMPNLAGMNRPPISSEISVVPSNATNKTLSYSSTDPNVITIAANGTMTIKAPGETTITVTANGSAEPKLKLDYKFKVMDAVTKVTFGSNASSQLPARSAAVATGNANTAPSRIEAEVGETIDLSGFTVTVEPSTALQTIYMTSSDTSVATFDTDGSNIVDPAEVAARKLKALRPGVTMITVEALGSTPGTSLQGVPYGRCYVVVKPKAAADFLGTASFASATESTVGNLVWSDAVRVSNARGKQTMPDNLAPGEMSVGDPYGLKGGKGAGYDFREMKGISSATALAEQDYDLYGDLFTWPVVEAYAAALCPSPWRVPTAQDFYNMANAAQPGQSWSTDAAGIAADMQKFFLPGVIAAPAAPWDGTAAWKGRINGVANMPNQWGQFSEFPPIGGYWSASEVVDNTAPAGMTSTVTDSNWYTTAFALNAPTNTNLTPATPALKNQGRALRCVKDVTRRR